MKDKKYLTCESNVVFLMLMFVAGFYGAYTYTMKGQVFCNAQTGNLVLFGTALGTGNIKDALYYIIPISAYVLGAVVSEALPNLIKHSLHIRWDTLLILLEIMTVVFLGFLPSSAPVQITQVCINFICSMQFATFRQAEGLPMATTFCTNHIRQTGIALVKALRHRKEGNKADIKKLRMHIGMLLCFTVGAVSSASLTLIFKDRTIFFSLLPLLILFTLLLHSDKEDADKLELKPMGH
ncbi:MAG: DUF1275 domain-containing protein [Firmicutes bacterium]|nr:DUF1275 domain-containing protein [Bacillota bacterium]